MDLPARIETDRLRLVLVTPVDAADMRAGRRQRRWHPSYPRAEDVAVASLVTEHVGAWGPRHVVLGQQAVGTLACFAPPEQGEAEVGFGLVPEARGDGVATEALRALVAAAEGVGVRLRATVFPDNAAALRVLAKGGFTELRGGDEDGALVMARPAAAVGG